MSVMKRSEGQNGNRGQPPRTRDIRMEMASCLSLAWLVGFVDYIESVKSKRSDARFQALLSESATTVGCTECACGSPGATRSSQGESGHTVNRVSKAVSRGFHLVPWNRLMNEKHLLLEAVFYFRPFG